MTGLILLLMLTSAPLLEVWAKTTATIQNHWQGGFNGQLQLQIPQDMDTWKVHIIFDKPVESLDVGEGTVTKFNDYEYILAGTKRAQSGSNMNVNLNGKLTGDDYPTSVCAYFDAAGTSYVQKDYKEALRLSLLFYYAQRSGKLPADNPIPWRNDSALTDCVVGGWYDAGDHVKFGFPMAGALTMLLWGVERFKDGYEAAGQLDKMYDTVKWGLDYLLDAWDPFTRELVIQASIPAEEVVKKYYWTSEALWFVHYNYVAQLFEVGDGDTDHQFWGRPEEMNMPRPCIKIGPGRPGSDVAGETVAALAAGAIVFREKGDMDYAAELLEAAESLYTFAEDNRGRFSDNPPLMGNSWYYSSLDDRDEMCEAAAWLYKATGEEDYLVDAKNENEGRVPTELSWEDKMASCHLLLYNLTGSQGLKRDVQNFLSSWQPGANVAFSALLAAEDGIDPEVNRKWAAEQINYLLGDNPHDGGCFSYEIGYGSKYPLQPHHRAAPQTLYGGLVGGPDWYDRYNDTREDYVHNEVALDYNAGFQSALAGLVQLRANNELPDTKNLCPCYQ
ncbi:hypothetical protein BaRGS_00027354 [Batillaria attramentaria]|uniref:Endoglucanase n=1 Tax=Batillaria attramentaria TaxID=370345 RepID=A0ABD0K2W8_9CAEN